MPSVDHPMQQQRRQYSFAAAAGQCSPPTCLFSHFGTCRTEVSCSPEKKKNEKKVSCSSRLRFLDVEPAGATPGPSKLRARISWELWGPSQQASWVLSCWATLSPKSLSSTDGAHVALDSEYLAHAQMSWGGREGDLRQRPDRAAREGCHRNKSK